LQETHSLAKIHTESEKIYQANGDWMQAGVAIFISDKIDFKPKLEEIKKVTSYWQKEKIHQEDRKIINIYTLNIGAPNFLKQILFNNKGQRCSHIIIVGV
jgi:hypothetical protein